VRSGLCIVPAVGLCSEPCGGLCAVGCRGGSVLCAGHERSRKWWSSMRGSQ
jgi:hypothetical protein